MSAVLHITVVTHKGMKVNLVNFPNRWTAEDAKKEILDNYEGLAGADIRVTVLNGGSV